ncbi:MAG: hypothetical protein Q8Q14_10900 [Gemmatimonadales bacterium]|nr:hypothetical protein [Gemmatimonadales bacterium]
MATKAKRAEVQTERQDLTIPPIDVKMAGFTIRGISPVLSHALGGYEGKSMEGPKNKQKTRDLEAEFRASLYPVPGHAGAFGIPAAAFKSAIVDACRYVDGMKATLVRGALYVLGDVIEIRDAKPRLRRDVARIGRFPTRTPDLRVRGEFPLPWSALLPIRFSASVLSVPQIANLLNNAGFSVGVGDWRPAKCGSFGQFSVASADFIDRV